MHLDGHAELRKLVRDMLMSRTVFLITLIFGLAVSARAQSTYPAASCNEADVQSAFTTEQASAVDGDIITIPAGTCTWNSLWNLSPTHTLTFQGAGALTPSTSCTFTPGSACTTTSGSDQTVLVNGTLSSGMINVTMPANKTIRITGVEYSFASGGSESGNGQWAFHCTTGNCNLRLDHNHFNGYAGKWIVVYGWGPFGVADHNLVDLFQPVTNWISVFNGEGWNNDNLSFGNGNGSWADASKWGSSQAFFMEDNEFPNDESVSEVAVNDCSNGGRQVIRYNTFESPANGIQGHEGGTDNRGCRTTEIYGNTSNTADTGQLGGVRSGSTLLWGNVGNWDNMFTAGVDRGNTVNGTFNPTNLGLCGYNGTATSSGSTVTWVSTASQFGSVQFFTNWPDLSTPNMTLNGSSFAIASVTNGTTLTLTGLTGSNPSAVPWSAPSVWDGNTDSSGYPCYDQPGRGQGDLIVGSFSNGTRKDNVTGTPHWPNEAVDPNYVFDNTNNLGAGHCVGIDSSNVAVLKDNRDYYQQFGTGCEAGSWNGTAGINQSASAPSGNCTAGPGGNTPGVGWWDTTNNTLYVCNPTNTWTAYYTPYTYPHPLETSSSTFAPKPPTNLTATVK